MRAVARAFRRTVRRAALLVLATTAVPVAADAQDPAGHREGEIRLPGAALEVDIGGAFRLRELNGYWVGLELDAAGPATAAILHQPNGVFRAERPAAPS